MNGSIPRFLNFYLYFIIIYMKNIIIVIIHKNISTRSNNVPQKQKLVECMTIFLVLDKFVYIETFTA